MKLISIILVTATIKLMNSQLPVHQIEANYILPNLKLGQSRIIQSYHSFIYKIEADKLFSYVNKIKEQMNLVNTTYIKKRYPPATTGYNRYKQTKIVKEADKLFSYVNKIKEQMNLVNTTYIKKRYPPATTGYNRYKQTKIVNVPINSEHEIGKDQSIHKSVFTNFCKRFPFGKYRLILNAHVCIKISDCFYCKFAIYFFTAATLPGSSTSHVACVRSIARKQPLKGEKNNLGHEGTGVVPKGRLPPAQSNRF
ncbi:hypothetical protein QE152_g22008 [Popillia japonica]|uniref:Uncharacterized protein n=1 Tax=Popillia japonica TaxID=7064 RepID=A0AAW1KMI3_POPJA